MRIFYALEFSRDTKEKIDFYAQEIYSDIKLGMRTDLDNYHITLHFVGEIEDEEVQNHIKLLEEISKKNCEFELELNGIGFFKKKSRYIVWIGLKSAEETLYKISAEIKREFSKEENTYIPHITIARNVELLNTEEEIALKGSGFLIKEKIEAISLMESTRIDGKLVYRSIAKKNLRNKDIEYDR